MVSTVPVATVTIQSLKQINFTKCHLTLFLFPGFTTRQCDHRRNTGDAHVVTFVQTMLHLTLIC